MPAKVALLVGCNYPGTNAELRGCINDVMGMKAMLTEYFGFDLKDITVMIDTDPSTPRPDGKNIKNKLKELVANARNGDMVLFHFSGHGTQVPGGADEADGKDEAICPTDLNVITDDDLRAILTPLKEKPGVKFTMIADCCHSGTLLDHESVQISGPKAGSAPLPAFDSSTIMALLGSMAQPAGREIKNRALPTNQLFEMLSQLLGSPVDASNVRSGMGSLFGADASNKIQNLMQYAALAQKLLAAGGAGQSGAKQEPGGLGALCGLFSACLGGGPTPTQSTVMANTSDPAEPALAIKPPVAGAKPPSDQRLADDIGILITGCQSHETSADACPSGDAKQAHGALSNAIQTVVKQHFAQNGNGTPLPYRNLVVSVRELLGKTGFTQNPCLECSDQNADTAFIVA